MSRYEEAIQILIERYCHDNLISVATIDNNRPFVRIVNGYYEEGSFYVVTYALSNKMQQIKNNPEVAYKSNSDGRAGTPPGKLTGYEKRSDRL
jgi:uncharacterized pyridoxamine 5'-phosphate oxidase family protein